MSSALFAQILFLIGLNFINVACLAAKQAPSHRFAVPIDDAPEKMFFDIEAEGNRLWLAGDGVFRMANGGPPEKIMEDSRVTSLLLAGDDRTLWFAGSGGVGRLDLKTLEREYVVAGFDYIWELIELDEKIWFIESQRVGWLNVKDMSIGAAWEASFLPRPFISVTESPQRVWVSSVNGLYELDQSGYRQVLSSQQLAGEMVAWVQQVGEEYYLGTSGRVYQWDGEAAETLAVLDSNYPEFFKEGINNAVATNNRIAITRYPLGVAFWDPETKQVEQLVSKSARLNIGDVFKVASAGPDSIIMLGESGIAKIDATINSVFFPASELYGTEVVREVIPVGGSGIIFTDYNMYTLSESGYVIDRIKYAPDWVDVDHNNQLVIGSVTGYQTLRGGEPEEASLSVGVFDLQWGKHQAYAVGSEGVYRISPDLEMELIFDDKRQMRLLGEWNGSCYLMTGEGVLLQLRDTESGWTAETLQWQIDNSLVWSGATDEGLWISATKNLYRLDGDKLETYPVASGWNVLSSSATNDQLVVLYEEPVRREWAVGVYSDGSSYMLVLPYKEHIGEPISIMATDKHIGIVGSGGTGWYDRAELAKQVEPRVDFALLFENKRIEDRTIPSGMHYIDLQIMFSDPSPPCVVEYRINEDRWRTINLQDPSLQFAGHGTFSVELRAVHPNGSVSSSRLIQFGIAPPWYLNPVYQGMLALLAALLIWLIFFIRSRQLKRTNLWLQSEVKKQTRELEAVTAARTNFLAGLSHDIRNPLNGVLMIAETLGRKPPKNTDDPRLKDLREFGIIVDRMLGEILDFSAIDQDNIPTAFTPVSINDIIESSVKQNQFMIQHEMVSIETSVDAALKDVIIRTDRNWMIKILSNLIVNALEYSGSATVEVGARCIRKSEADVHMELFVNDWGIGIDDSEKEYVFERFYRGEVGIESGRHGTGLGLSICQEIAHAMGGHIRIDDNDPSGCKFILNGRFERVEGSTELDTDAVLEKLRGKHILVVDDLVYNRRSTVDFFQTIGCTCDQAEGGREALDKLEKNDFYLALLDWDLPGIMGPEIARRYRKKVPDDPVIMISVTAYTDGEKKRESEEAGMNGYISKPLTANKLAHCLANIQNWSPARDSDPDVVDVDEVQDEIYIHIEDCLHYGENFEWENLRRCAHRLTTLALIKNNRVMQQICRDLQIAASESNIKESQALLLELHKWRKS